MIDRTDPERWRFIEEKIGGAHEQFGRGEITEAVYRASLYALGQRGEEIDINVRLHRPFVSAGEIARRVVDGFVSGLPDRRRA